MKKNLSIFLLLLALLSLALPVYAQDSTAPNTADDEGFVIVDESYPEDQPVTYTEDGIMLIGEFPEDEVVKEGARQPVEMEADEPQYMLAGIVVFVALLAGTVVLLTKKSKKENN